MISFSDYKELTEKLTIVKKAGEVPLEPHKAFDVQKYKVTPTFHLKAARKEGEEARDDTLTQRDLTRIITKALSHGLDEIDNCYVHLIMKSSDGKYDDFIVFKKGISITITTVLLQGRNKPNYFTKPDDCKLIIEKFLGNIITLEID